MSPLPLASGSLKVECRFFFGLVLQIVFYTCILFFLVLHKGEKKRSEFYQHLWLLLRNLFQGFSLFS